MSLRSATVKKIEAKIPRILLPALIVLIFFAGALAADPPTDRKEETKPPAAAVKAEEPMALKGFRFTGNTSFSTAELNALLAPYVGRATELSVLREATEVISGAYAKRGLKLAKAYLPAQEVKDGIVDIVILEGRLGDVIVEGNRNYRAEFIRGFLKRSSGDENIADEVLERGMLLLNTGFPHLNVTASLEKGRLPGTVDIRAKVSDAFPLSATLTADNMGSESTSRIRYGGSIEWTNALISGGTLTMGGVVGERPEHLAHWSGTYAVPVNYYGTRAVLTGSYGKFDVGKEFSDLGITNKETNFSFFLTHPFVKTRTSEMSLGFGFAWSDAKYYLLDEISSRDKIRSAYGELSASKVFWNGRSLLTMNLSGGLGNFVGGTEEGDTDVSRTGGDNTFTKFTMSVARIQGVTDWFSILGRAAGQAADTSLLAGEEWQVGGRDSVRGFAPGEFSGDQGYSATLELRLSPFKNRELLVMSAFGDYGAAFRRKTDPGQEDEGKIAGAGVGLSTHIDFGLGALDLRGDVGWPICPKENSLDEKPVYYLSASAVF